MNGPVKNPPRPRIDPRGVVGGIGWGFNSSLININSYSLFIGRGGEVPYGMMGYIFGPFFLLSSFLTLDLGGVVVADGLYGGARIGQCFPRALI